MANLSRAAITKLAISAGFNSKDADIASAVAIAESGGNPNAHNSTPPDDSYGLWQINMLGSLGPARRKQFGISNNNQLFDPKTNAKAAFKIYASAGYTFKPWTTFTSGDYKKHLNDDTGAQAVANAPGAVSDAASAVPNAINAFSNNLFKVGSNIGGIILAVVLLIVGVLILILVNGGAAKKALKLTPVGKVASKLT